MSEEAQGAEVPAAAPAAGGDAASIHGSQVGSAVGSRAASIAGDVAPVGQIGGEPGPGSVANESVHGAATHAPRVPVKLEDVVAKNRRWAEACDKETKMIRLSTTFMVGNRNNLDIFPEKPNRLNLPVVNADVARESNELLDSVCSVKDAVLLPAEKYELPQTMAQEVGFHYKPLVAPNPMFQRGRAGCEITAYAENYVETTGVGPYARKKITQASRTSKGGKGKKKK